MVIESIHIVQHTTGGLPQAPHVFKTDGEALKCFAQYAVGDGFREPGPDETIDGYIDAYTEEWEKVSNGMINKDNEINYWEIEIG